MRVAKCDFMKTEQVLGTRDLCRRRQTGPESRSQIARLGHPSYQNGNAKFLGVCQILPRIHSVARQAGCAPACCHWIKRHLCMASRATKSLQRNQESIDRGDCARRA